MYLWFCFFVLIFAALAIDLGVTKHPKVMTLREATKLTSIWVFLAFLFNVFIFIYFGKQKALDFVTGYIIELSLSMDNVFVFIVIFSYFKVEPRYQHRILFWGIVGAIIMRLVMITGGIYLVENFNWTFYLFGALLIFSAYKIVFSEQHEVDFDNNKIIKWLKKYLPFTNQYRGERFMVVENGKKYFTPLMLVLIIVEQTDLVFAVDSIPAILAITQDTFIVFTSNIFAILGLRSLYFLLANIVDRFAYLKYGLGVILAYVGVKMILSVNLLHIPIFISLAVIIISLLISIGASWVVTLKR